MRGCERAALALVLLALNCGWWGPAWATAAHSNASVLRYRFRVGTAFNLHLTRSIALHAVVSGKPSASDILIEHDVLALSTTVQRVYADGSALVRVSYARIGVNVHDNQQPSTSRRALYTAPRYYQTLHLASDGTELPGGQQFGANPAATTFGDMLKVPVLPQLPQQPIAVGSTWMTHPSALVESSLLANFGPLAIHSQAQLVALAGHTATISDHQHAQARAQQRGITATATYGFTQTEQLSLDNAGLLKQQSALRLRVIASGSQGGTFDLQAVVDLTGSQASTPPPPIKIPSVAAGPGPFVAVATTLVGPTPGVITVDAAGDRAFVGNGDDDTVTVLDARKGTVTGSIQVGTGPEAMALDAPRHQVLVLSSGNPASSYALGSPSSVSFLDATTGHVLRTVATGPYPAEMAVDAQHARAYVSNSRSQLRVLDTVHGRLLARIPMPAGTYSIHSPVVDAARHRLYVLTINSGDSAGDVVIVDTATDTVVRTTPLPGIHVEQLGYDPEAGHLFVTGEAESEGSGQGRLFMLDARYGKILHIDTSFGAEPDAIAIAGRDGHLFVVDAPESRVLMASTRSGKLLRSISVRPQPDVLALDATRDRLYVEQDSSSIGAIDAATGRVLGYAKTTGAPYIVTVDHATGALLVADPQANTVSILVYRGS
ncbi:MAG TPA: PQQ-binding-like beta-propeller repeat protein [Chloroflexota bacterium]|nr:PQQ-binding-like beta-propeller repeat protein [Chloroflexota bacterium]